MLKFKKGGEMGMPALLPQRIFMNCHYQINRENIAVHVFEIQGVITLFKILILITPF